MERRVRAILQLEEEQQLSESFIAERREAGLFVELRSADSTTLGERLLPHEGTCEELAQAAAVVLSVWLSDVHPDFAPALPETSPVAPPAPLPEAEPPPAPPAASAPAPAPFPPPAVNAPPSPSSADVEVDAGAGAGVADGSFVFAGALGVALVSRIGGGARLGGRATVLLDTARSEPLGGGSVSWRRWPLSMGPSLRFTSATVAYDVTLAPALVWLRASGSELTPSLSRGGITWAGVAEVRAASRGRLGVFAALHGQAYLVPSTAYAGTAEYGLPPFVATLLLGARLLP